MKYFLITILIIPFSLAAQNTVSQHTQVEISGGLVFPFLGSGEELTRSRDLRDSELSFFADEDGSRRNVGSYPTLFGWKLNIAYYKPVNSVSGLMLGAVVQLALTGSQPSTGGYDEGYFFNYTTVGFAAKYYPLTNANLFLKSDIGLASVFTKNRFINAAGEQNFFHQFGIGFGGGIGVGYAFSVFRNPLKTLEISAHYQLLNSRVEVDGIGDDQWTYGGLSVQAGINF